LAPAGAATGFEAAGAFVVPDGFAELPDPEAFAAAGGDPTAVVRARVTLGFGFTAFAGVAGLVVGSGRGVWSAMRLA